MKATLRAESNARLAQIAAIVANPTALYKDTGRRLTTELRKHFRHLEQTRPNQLGAPRTHYWQQIHDATGNPEVSPTSATVTIADVRFAQTYYGGTITAKNARALTIPLSPLAHGRRASVFEEETGKKLFRVKSKNPRIARLLMADMGDRVVPIYALATSIHQDPDPGALPREADLEAAILDTAEKHLARQLARLQS